MVCPGPKVPGPSQRVFFFSTPPCCLCAPRRSFQCQPANATTAHTHTYFRTRGPGPLLSILSPNPHALRYSFPTPIHSKISPNRTESKKKNKRKKRKRKNKTKKNVHTQFRRGETERTGRFRCRGPRESYIRVFSNHLFFGLGCVVTWGTTRGPRVGGKGSTPENETAARPTRLSCPICQHLRKRTIK